MSRYIDAVIAAEKISEKHNIPLSELVDTFAEIPATDVVEIKHGEWNRTTSDYECSKCNYPMDYITPYCPYCGADMRGDNR